MGVSALLFIRTQMLLQMQVVPQGLNGAGWARREEPLRPRCPHGFLFIKKQAIVVNSQLPVRKPGAHNYEILI